MAYVNELLSVDVKQLVDQLISWKLMSNLFDNW